MGHSKPAFLLLVFVVTTAAWGQSLNGAGTDASGTDTSGTDGAGGTASAAAPTPTPAPTPKVVDDSRQASDNPVKFLRNLAYDQKAIWTSPFKARIEDLNWIVPLVGVSAGLINADAELSSRITGTDTFSRHSSTISNAGLGLALGGSGGLYLLGKFKHDDRQKETGILAIEAATDSLVVGEVLKAVTQRARRTDGNKQGDFFNSSSITNSSFPSAHALMVWSAASVFAPEY